MNRKTKRVLTDEDVAALIAKLNDTPGEFPWAGVERLSSIFFLPDELRDNLTESLKTIELSGGTFVERAKPLGDSRFDSFYPQRPGYGRGNG